MFGIWRIIEKMPKDAEDNKKVGGHGAA
jgi:hypothetical protein